MSAVIPVPAFCRLEILTPKGWELVNAGVSLLYPERYPARLRERGKFGRCTVLSEDLQTVVATYVADDVPEDPSVLVPCADGSRAPRLPDPTKDCAVCGEEHMPPYDGSCLL